MAKFALGDEVEILDSRGNVIDYGVIDFDSGFDEHLGDRRYKVRTAHNRKNWNAKSLRKISRGLRSAGARPKSRSFGVMPSLSDFKKTTQGHYPYPMELVGGDESAMRNILAMNSDIRVDKFIPRQYPDKFGVRVKSAETMYKLLSALAETGDEHCESLASSIMGTLGYEWV